MVEVPRLGPEAYLNTGAIVWFVGFLVYYLQPAAMSVRAAGYLYGVLALVGGAFIGFGLAHADLPVP